MVESNNDPVYIIIKKLQLFWPRYPNIKPRHSGVLEWKDEKDSSYFCYWSKYVKATAKQESECCISHIGYL